MQPLERREGAGDPFSEALRRGAAGARRLEERIRDEEDAGREAKGTRREAEVVCHLQLRVPEVRAVDNVQHIPVLEGGTVDDVQRTLVNIYTHEVTHHTTVKSIVCDITVYNIGVQRTLGNIYTEELSRLYLSGDDESTQEANDRHGGHHPHFLLSQWGVGVLYSCHDGLQ